MLTSLALIFLLGLFLGKIFKTFKLPSLLGMLLTGIILGPYTLNLIDPSLLGISADLRQLALIIILTRAGLALNIKDLKAVGRPAVLMCFVPACCEIAGMILVAPKLLGISVIDAAVMGSVVAAVSPAVVVPKMLGLMDKRCGTNKSIPQMIMASTSVDDVFVIVLFTAFVGLAQGESISPISIISVPISIATGILVGIISGWLMSLYFKTVHMRDTVKVVIILSISFLLVAFESYIKPFVPFSGLLAIMSMSASISHNRNIVAKRLSAKFNKVWVGAEILLFVLVGATVDLHYAASAGIGCIIVIFTVLIFRMAGVYLCLIKTPLNSKERLFCMIAYCPKATVQAAIGSLPLAMGLSCGSIVLTVAVLAIIITAPLGAFLIDLTHTKLLCTE